MSWVVKIEMTDAKARRYRATGTFTEGVAPDEVASSYSCAGQLDPERTPEENRALIAASLLDAREKALAKIKATEIPKDYKTIEADLAVDLNAAEVR